MTQGVPGEDEMTSRAGQALLDDPRLRRADIGRDALGEAVAAIEKEVRDDIRARLGNPYEWNPGYCPWCDKTMLTEGHASDCLFAAISSSSATETQDGERHPDVPNDRVVLADPDSPMAWAIRLGTGAIVVKDNSGEICTLILGDINSVARRLQSQLDRNAATPTPDDRDREVKCVSCDDDHDANIHDHHWHDLDKTTYIGMEHGRELTDSEDAAENATWD